MKKLILATCATLPLPLHAALVEMWTFNNVPLGAVPSGTTSVGVNGRIATILGDGASSDATFGPGVRGINLPGGASGNAGYIDLPNGLASANGPDLTLNTWMTIDSLNAWSRVFDFGSSDTGVGTQGGEVVGPGGGGQGFEYILLSAMNGTDQNAHRMENRENAATTNTQDGTSIFTLGSEHLWSFVWDDIGGQSTQAYYFDGVLQAQSAPFASNLAQLNDVNNWLGRSNWTGDANTDGTYDQFAVYNTAFTGAEVLASFNAGPVPEPSGTLMLAGSLLGLLARRRRA